MSCPGSTRVKDPTRGQFISLRRSWAAISITGGGGCFAHWSPRPEVEKVRVNRLIQTQSIARLLQELSLIEAIQSECTSWVIRFGTMLFQ